jgi:hypothetical protein
MDIKVGDRLATVYRSLYSGEIREATIYTVVRTTAKTGWLDNGERFRLKDPYSNKKNEKLESVTPEIEEANKFRIQKEKEAQIRESEMGRLHRLVSKIQVGGFKCLSPEAVTRIADAIQKELTNA